MNALMFKTRIIFFIFFLSACSAPHFVNSTRFHVDSLPGSWRTVSPDSSRFEIWQIQTDSSLSGIGGLLAGSDTLITETLHLTKNNGKWIYVATVSDQNEGRPVSFQQTAVSATSIEFTNLRHDFPQRLVYTFISDDTLQVDVSGGTDFISLRFVRQP